MPQLLPSPVLRARLAPPAHLVPTPMVVPSPARAVPPVRTLPVDQAPAPTVQGAPPLPPMQRLAPRALRESKLPPVPPPALTTPPEATLLTELRRAFSAVRGPAPLARPARPQSSALRRVVLVRQVPTREATLPLPVLQDHSWAPRTQPIALPYPPPLRAAR